MSNMLALLAATGGGAPKLYADDVFQSYTRTGTSASTTVTTGIDMTKGYTLHSKGRSGATDHAVYDSARGVTFDLVTNTTAAQTTQATGLTAVSTTGHTLGALAKMNTNAATYVDWIFREAAKFHKVVSVVKSAGSNATVDLSSLGTVGMVKVKRTDAAGSWYVWHRSLTSGKLLIGETTAAEATLGHITVSGTTLTLVNGVIADGTYHVEAYAHDTGADGLIQCGSFTTDGSGNATVNLGWEPQYVLLKQVTGAQNWFCTDVSRKLVAGPNNAGHYLSLNTSDAEVANGLAVYVNSTGFTLTISPSVIYTYCVIRRPNKPPTLGTQVYNAIARTGTGAAATVTGVGFAPDLVAFTDRDKSINTNHWWSDRLRASSQELSSTSTAVEGSASSITAFSMDGFNLSTGSHSNFSGINYINHFFRRAPGFMDVSCDTGTGSAHTLSHNLTVVPELMIRKARTATGTGNWLVYFAALGNTKYLMLNSTMAADTVDQWNNTTPTASVFSVSNGVTVNGSGGTYVTYLAASLSGVSKIGSYVGNGTSQTINCGFTAGARFILIKSSSTTGAWTVIDSVRGIVAGNDPYLLLNSTAAEVTGEDCVDPDSSGFIVNTTTAALNTNGVTYQFWAIA